MRVRRTHLAALAALLVTAGLLVPGGATGLLHLAPAFLLLLPLLRGRYVGEERMLALRARARLPRAALRLRARLPRAPRVSIAGGRLALAAGLALRGPPALPACG